MIIFLLSILAIFFFFCEGKRDGSFYHAQMKTPDPVKENLHWLYFATRFIVMWLMFVVTRYAYPNQITLAELLFFLPEWIPIPRLPIVSSLFFVSLAFIFSFVHNGVYYLTRHKLDNNIYPKGFWSDSTSSTAKLEFSVKERTIMAVIGVLGVITSIII